MDSIRQCLATIQPDANQGFAGEISDHLQSSNRSQRIVIVSTRGQQDVMNHEGSLRSSCHWINVSAGESRRYFRSENEQAFRFIQSSIGSVEGGER